MTQLIKDPSALATEIKPETKTVLARYRPSAKGEPGIFRQTLKTRTTARNVQINIGRNTVGARRGSERRRQ